jgi:ComF family protein
MIAEELADKFIEKINKERIFLPKDAVLIPIPLYQKRKNWRGFNQSEEIGKMIANKLKWEYQQDILVRTRKTIPQTELKGQERLQNISGAFSPNSDNLKPDKTYILLDDVLTTGSTLKEACKKLKQNGAKTVWGITIAC